MVKNLNIMKPPYSTLKEISFSLLNHRVINPSKVARYGCLSNTVVQMVRRDSMRASDDRVGTKVGQNKLKTRETHCRQHSVHRMQMK